MDHVEPNYDIINHQVNVATDSDIFSHGFNLFVGFREVKQH